MKATILTLAALTAACIPLAAAAQTYPSKPVKFIVPYAPGGLPDTVARWVSQRLTERLGQSVVVDSLARDPRFADNPWLRRAGVQFYAGVPLVDAAGMVLGMALKMGTKLKPPIELVGVGLLALLAGAWLRLPLPVIVLGLGPLGIWLALRRARAA